VVVRLDQIDAPEKAQPFGQRAGQSLADLAFQKKGVEQAVVSPAAI